MNLRAITWNLFHGRDFPPDPALFTRRSRFLGVAETGETHVQVNRDLFDEFAALLAAAEWDVALLQECPPRWSERLGAACDAQAHRVLTSRNTLAPLRSALAAANPDLLGAAEGGSNTTLVRSRARPELRIVEQRTLTLTRLWPERRTMAYTRLECGICLANLHATNDRPPHAERELELAARTAAEWAGDAPLLLGGDFNVRPAESALFGRLTERHGFSPPGLERSIDHLLGAGMATLRPPRAWPAAARDVPSPDHDGLSIRLSDHAPVEAAFAIAADGRE